MKPIYIIISVALSLGLSFIIGRQSKVCPLPATQNQIQQQIKAIEDETEHKVNSVNDLNVEQLDSVWAKYQQRYGKD